MATIKASGFITWEPNKQYEVGDIVIFITPNTPNGMLQCNKAGISGKTSPTIKANIQPGDLLLDNSITWEFKLAPSGDTVNNWTYDDVSDTLMPNNILDADITDLGINADSIRTVVANYLKRNGKINFWKMNAAGQVILKTQEEIDGDDSGTDTSTDTSSSSSENGVIYQIGTGLELLDDNTLEHKDYTTAGTVGTKIATQGAIVDVPYFIVNQQGHITEYGTKKHTVTTVQANGYMPLTGGTMTGSIINNTNNGTEPLYISNNNTLLYSVASHYIKDNNYNIDYISEDNISNIIVNLASTNTDGNEITKQAILSSDGNDVTLSLNNNEVLTCKTGNAQYDYTTNKPQFGYILIDINSQEAWGLSFTVRLYQSYNTNDITISGYNGGIDYWYKYAAKITNNDDTVIPVYFGYRSTNKLYVAFLAKDFAGVDIFGITNGNTRIKDTTNLFTITNVEELPGEVQEMVNAESDLSYNILSTNQLNTTNGIITDLTVNTSIKLPGGMIYSK